MTDARSECVPLTAMIIRANRRAETDSLATSFLPHRLRKLLSKHRKVCSCVNLVLEASFYCDRLVSAMLTVRTFKLSVRRGSVLPVTIATRKTESFDPMVPRVTTDDATSDHAIAGVRVLDTVALRPSPPMRIARAHWPRGP